MKVLQSFGLGLSLALLAPLALAAEEPISKSITVHAPTHNTDGTLLTDLAKLKVYWRVLINGEATEQVGSEEVPFTEAGGVHSDTMDVTVVGDYGDEVVVEFFATAIDAQGNESDTSNLLATEPKTIVDNTVPNSPVIEWVVPVAIHCVTSKGDVCGFGGAG